MIRDYTSKSEMVIRSRPATSGPVQEGEFAYLGRIYIASHLKEWLERDIARKQAPRTPDTLIIISLNALHNLGIVISEEEYNSLIENWESDYGSMGSDSD